MITDEQRRGRGLRTVEEVLALAEAGTVVLDPYSVLIGARVQLGTENVLYPGVVIESHPDPDHRGAVLKGFGIARNLVLGAGDVMNGRGDFSAAPLERQRAYHPNAPKLPA